MNWIVFHVASGQAFFSGVFLILCAALASTRSHRVLRRLSGLLLVLGLIAVAISSTAISYWWYGAACLATLIWGVSMYKRQSQTRSAMLLAIVWLVAAGMELPYHLTRAPRRAVGRSLTVIGDSVTAGMGGNDESETWPKIIAREYNLTVQDLSHVGETAGSALKRAKSSLITSPIVLVEIGGNDILGSTSTRQFAKDLDALLAFAANGNRQVIMFELPLPPFYHEYGRIQRSLAAKHGVNLVPKRVFLSIIAGGDSTLDTIHLSQEGHQIMADRVWQLMRSAFHENPAS